MTDLTVLNNFQAKGSEDLLAKLQRVEASVRSEPAAHAHRWAMVEILCQLCQWPRALQQLQAWGRLAPQWKAQAHLVRGLIQAEHQRVAVFSGHERAAPVVDFPDWMALMAQALEHNALGQVAQADACRQQALELAPSRGGVCRWDVRSHAHEPAQSHEQAFEWLADSDSRLGPICEVMASGAYRWVAFADIASLQIQPPQSPLDLVWVPAQLLLRGPQEGETGRSMHVFLPARSCWTQPPTRPTEQQLALLMGHLTVWQEAGETGVFALGQRTWMSDGVDWSLLDIREVST